MSALEVPYDFLCPITQEVMKHPVMNKYGINYERRAILEWLNENNTCPMTRNPLRPSMLLPNVRLETEVRAWLKENGEVSELQLGDFMGALVCVKTPMQVIKSEASTTRSYIETGEIAIF
jgi:hypothetical protein